MHFTDSIEIKSLWSVFIAQACDVTLRRIRYPNKFGCLFWKSILKEHYDLPTGWKLSISF